MVTQKKRTNQPSAKGHTIRKEAGRFKVFHEGKYCLSFGDEVAAKAYIAAKELKAHVQAKRAAVTLALVLALLLPQLAAAGGSGITPPRVTKRLICHVQRGVKHCRYVVVTARGATR